MGSIGHAKQESLGPEGRLRAVLFDWDGTLLDSAEASFRSYARLFSSYGISFDRRRFAETYSPDWYRTYEALELPHDRWEEADARWIALYAEERSRLLPDAARALRRLRGAALATALVTSGSRARIERELEAHKMTGAFDLVLCCGDIARKKPDPEILLAALSRLRLPPRESAYVGDSPEDIRMARAAGVLAIGIPGAFPNRETLQAARPDLLVGDLSTAVNALLARSKPPSPFP